MPRGGSGDGPLVVLDLNSVPYSLETEPMRISFIAMMVVCLAALTCLSGCQGDVEVYDGSDMSTSQLTAPLDGPANS